MQPNDTKEKLEMKALHFFALHDYERSSLNEIAETLGVTKGAIYHYFKNKDELFHSSVIRLLDVMGDWFINSLPTDIPLKIILDNLFNIEASMKEMAETTGLGAVVLDYTNTLYLMLSALKKFPDLKVRLEAIYAGFRHALIRMMQISIERKEIRADADVEAVAFEITAFYEGALLLAIFSSSKDYITLGPRVCREIWNRMAIPEQTDRRQRVIKKEEG